MARQHLPLERTKEAISDLLGLNCSTGFLDDVYNEGAKGLGTFIDEVTSQLSGAEVVHFDETSIKVKKGPSLVTRCFNQRTDIATCEL